MKYRMIIKINRNNFIKRNGHRRTKSKGSVVRTKCPNDDNVFGTYYLRTVSMQCERNSDIGASYTDKTMMDSR